MDLFSRTSATKDLICVELLPSRASKLFAKCAKPCLDIRWLPYVMTIGGLPLSSVKVVLRSTSMARVHGGMHVAVTSEVFEGTSINLMALGKKA